MTVAFIGGLVASFGPAASSLAAEPTPATTTPWVSEAFVQAGFGDGKTRSLTLGLARDWAWQRPFGDGRLSGYWEASASGWSHPLPDGSPNGRLNQFELAPVLRYHGDDGRSRWFTEAAIGLTFTSQLFDNGSKRFSTRFNFGDHLAVGYQFGHRRQHTLAARVEHYSNAGIEQPNPGVNFVQLRYSFRLDCLGDTDCD